MTRYEVLPGESWVWVRARSSLHPIDSESAGLAGYVEAEVLQDGSVDLSVIPKARIEMEIQRLSSGNALYDREMRRRVDSQRWPVIRGEMTSMQDGGRDGCYLVSGDVTFRGVTRRYRDEVMVSSPAPATICLQGEHTFDLREFSFDPPRIMMLRVHPEVKVRVLVTARAGT